jgi:ZIP family zinc transporter
MLKSHRNQHYYFAFAAGSLIAVALLDLLPESLTIGITLGITFHFLLSVMLVSFFIYSFIDKFFLTHHLHDDDEHEHPMGFIGASSLIIHSCFDGVAIGIAFQANQHIGFIVAMAVIMHDMTDGLNTVVIMLKNKASKSKASLFLVLDALAPFLGIFITSFFVIPEKALAFLLMFFCGEFLYLGAGSLLPEIKKDNSLGITFSLLLGATVIMILTSFL